jgi:hypothetical protein
VKLGGKWRSGHPLAFFLLGQLVAWVVFVVGAVIFAAATKKHAPAAQPGGGIGISLFVVGFVLMVLLFVLGIVDLWGYLRRRDPAVNVAGQPHAEPRTKQDQHANADRPRRAGQHLFGYLRGRRNRAANVPGQLRAEPRPKRDHPASADRPPRARQQARNSVPADRTVTILMLGHSGSGKTIMLASLYHCFALGGRAGIRFTTDDASNNELLSLAAQIRDAPGGLFPAGTRPGQTKKWAFNVRVESGDQEADAFTLEYLDYAGGYVGGMLGSAGDDPPDAQFEQSVASADVLMGVLDGAQLRKLMSGGYDSRIVGPIERLLNILVRASQRNIHLVITKWDLMRGPGGEYYTITDVVEVLDRASDAFRDFRQNPRLGSLRVIPVSALGVNGFVRFAEIADGSMAKVPGKPWQPWNVEMPFFCAVPDIIRNDVAKMAGRLGGNVARITIAVLGAVGIISGVTLYGVTVTVPVADVIKRIQKYLQDRNERGKVPATLGENEAIIYVLNECYASVDSFERKWPDSRIGGSGGKVSDSA